MKIVVDARELTNLSAKLKQLPERLRDQATAAALNRTAEKGRTEVDRAVRAEYVIDAARVRNSMSLRRASSKGARLEAEILIFGSANKRGRSLNVIHFMERKVSLAEARRRAKKKELFVRGRTGRLLPILRFTFRRGSGAKVIEGAFVGNNGRTVFRRVGPARLPIEPVQVIDVPQMFRSQKITKRVMDRINRDLPVEVDRAVKAVLARAGLR